MTITLREAALASQVYLASLDLSDPMSHTVQIGLQNALEDNPCERLNPAAYRQVVEALRDYVEWHKVAIPESERDDYEREHLIAGSQATLAATKEES